MIFSISRSESILTESVMTYEVYTYTRDNMGSNKCDRVFRPPCLMWPKIIPVMSFQRATKLITKVQVITCILGFVGSGCILYLIRRMVLFLSTTWDHGHQVHSTVL